MRGCSTITGKEELYDWVIRNISKDKKILDVGFGWGAIGRYLRQYAYKYIDGLDVWPDEIDDYGLHSVYDNIFIGDMRNFEKYDKYDAIIYGDSLEHIPLKDATDLLERVRKEVDYLVISIPYNAVMQSSSDNPHDKHEQDTVDKEYMKEHYPYLTCIFEDSMTDYGGLIGVYVWSKH